MRDYTALVVDYAYAESTFGFVCQADDIDHAEEQALDAYPNCDVVWIEEGTDVEGAMVRYWDDFVLQ